MRFPAEVEKVFEILNESGYAAYAVGGCVRDFLLEKTPKDFDVTTDALPDDIMKLFSGYPVIPTGVKHGTVTVLINSLPIEITTYRTDGVYLDNRRPSEVIFSRNIADDLKRRDFTVNAIAYSPKEGFVDLFGGRTDLKGRLIRCVGDPGERFGEDALRILRAIRLAAALRFEIEEKTSQSVHQKKELLRNISAERINMELSSLLLSGNAARFLVSYRDVIGVFIPEIEGDPELKTKAKTLEAAEHLSVKLAVLLDGLFGWQKAASVLREMKYDGKTTRDVTGLLRYRNRTIQTSKKSIKIWMKTLGADAFALLLELKGLTENVREQKRIAQEILYNKECYTLKDLALDGRGLMQAGLTEGVQIGRMLNRLLVGVILEEIPNNKTALLEFAKRMGDKT